MHRFIVGVAMLLPIACTSTSDQAGPAQTAAAAASAGRPLQCINLDQVVSRRPAGPQSLMFELVGGRTYRNDLPGRCPGLERAGEAEIVQVEVTGSTLCRNDRVRIYDPVEARNIGAASFPHCRLGAFTPIAGRR